MACCISPRAMATMRTITIVAAARSPRAQLMVTRADRFRCAYSKESLKACSAMNLSPAVLKGLGLRRVTRPWGLVLVEERTDKEDTKLSRLSRALNPEWITSPAGGLTLSTIVVFFFFFFLTVNLVAV